MGRVRPHDDSVNDRSEGSTLCNSREVTEKLWKGEIHSFDLRNNISFLKIFQEHFEQILKHFNSKLLTDAFDESFSMPGAMFRGEPDHWRLQLLDSNYLS